MPQRRSATSHDVARTAGVSQPTVSRALRGDGRLSSETIRRVEQAATALNYVPSRRGRNLSTSSTGQVGVVVSDLNNPFYLEVLAAVHSELRAAGLSMLVLTLDPSDQSELTQLVDGSLDGAILTTTTLGSPLPAELAARQFPFVLLNREVDFAPGDVCVVDNWRGAALAAEELLRLGHHDIAAIFGPAETSTGRGRERGFRDVLEAAGIRLDAERWRRTPFDYRAGHGAALELFDAPTGPPTALFCANDVLALGAFNALTGRGIALPADLTLIGFDDVALAGWEAIGLTTVSQDLPRMARSAAELLLSRIGAGVQAPAPRRLVLEPELRLRRTHGPPRLRLTSPPSPGG